MTRTMLLLFCLVAGIHVAFADQLPASEPLQHDGGFALPVRIIEQPALSDDERASSKAADDRETADLAAQQAMVRETQNIVWISLFQVALAFVGTIGLIVTLVLNRRSLLLSYRSIDTTSAALEHARESSQIELRAYIAVEEVKVDLYRLFQDRVVPDHITVVFQNNGQTPASDVALFGYIMVAGPEARISAASFDNLKDDVAYMRRGGRSFSSRHYLNRGQRIHSKVPIDKSDVSNAIEMTEKSCPTGLSGLKLFVFGRIYYKDSFYVDNNTESSWLLKFCYSYWPDSPELLVYECYNSEECHSHVDQMLG